MDTRLETYLNPSYAYDFWSGPDVIQSKDEALANGINCISLAHLALQDLFECRLPQSLMCSELYKDREHFRPMNERELNQIGDLMWFGIEDPPVNVDEFVPCYEDGKLINWADFPVKHVAIHTGEDNDGDPLLLHSTSIVGTNIVWPMSYFKTYKRYRRFYGATRLLVASIPIERTILE